MELAHQTYRAEVALLHSENSPHTIAIWLSWGFQNCPNFQVTVQGIKVYEFTGVGLESGQMCLHMIYMYLQHV